jgi:hypothetical protein
MSDSRKSPDPTAPAGQMNPEDPLKIDDSRNLPPLRGEDEDDDHPRGPNLFIAFSIIGLALLIAFALAALIVWPYYKAR